MSDEHWTLTNKKTGQVIYCKDRPSMNPLDTREGYSLELWTLEPPRKRGSLELDFPYLSPHGCDGCGREVPIGEKMLIGIESCCGGGCSRALCKECVQWAAAQFTKE